MFVVFDDPVVLPHLLLCVERGYGRQGPVWGERQGDGSYFRCPTLQENWITDKGVRISLYLPPQTVHWIWKMVLSNKY